MEKYYAHYPFTITLTANKDVTGAIQTGIRFRKPGDADTDVFEIDATVINDETGELEAKLTAEQNNVVGKWAAWTYVMFANGNDNVGEPYLYTMNAEGY